MNTSAQHSVDISNSTYLAKVNNIMHKGHHYRFNHWQSLLAIKAV